MNPPKLPTEAELDMIEKTTDVDGEDGELAHMGTYDYRQLMAIGRAHYALRRKLREMIEELLGEDGA